MPFNMHCLNLLKYSTINVQNFVHGWHSDTSCHYARIHSYGDPCTCIIQFDSNNSWCGNVTLYDKDIYISLWCVQVKYLVGLWMIDDLIKYRLGPAGADDHWIRFSSIKIIRPITSHHSLNSIMHMIYSSYLNPSWPYLSNIQQNLPEMSKWCFKMVTPWFSTHLYYLAHTGF